MTRAGLPAPGGRGSKVGERLVRADTGGPQIGSHHGLGWTGRKKLLVDSEEMCEVNRRATWKSGKEGHVSTFCTYPLSVLSPPGHTD